MGKEIERKYLVVGSAWRGLATGLRYRQGYLSTAREHVVRVRTVEERGYLTVKGAAVGATRQEFEYEIPVADAVALLELCERPLVEKVRYTIPLGDLTWEVDEFQGANRGLIVAECELITEDQALDLPNWIGREVTGDPRYSNSNLVARPFTRW